MLARHTADSDGYDQAYDSHCNLVLGDVEETIYVVEEDENEEEITRVGNPVQTLALILVLSVDGYWGCRRSRSRRRCSLCEVSLPWWPMVASGPP